MHSNKDFEKDRIFFFFGPLNVQLFSRALERRPLAATRDLSFDTFIRSDDPTPADGIWFQAKVLKRTPAISSPCFVHCVWKTEPTHEYAYISATAISGFHASGDETVWSRGEPGSDSFTGASVTYYGPAVWRTRRTPWQRDVGKVHR